MTAVALAVGAVLACASALFVALPFLREPDPAEDRLEVLGLYWGAGTHRDLRGDDIRELSGEPTVLDRHGRRIACCIHAVEAGHIALKIHWDKALRPGRETVDPGPLEAR